MLRAMGLCAILLLLVALLSGGQEVKAVRKGQEKATVEESQAGRHSQKSGRDWI